METVVTPTKVEMESNANLNKPLTTKTANKQCSFAIKAIPMPEAIVSLLEQHAETLAQIEKCLRWDSNRRDLLDGQPIATESFDETLRNFFDEFHRVNAALKGSNEDSARQWNEAEITMDQIWAFGPKRARENLLINKIFDYNRPTIVELSRTSSKANLRLNH